MARCDIVGCLQCGAVIDRCKACGYSAPMRWHRMRDGWRRVGIEGVGAGVVHVCGGIKIETRPQVSAPSVASGPAIDIEARDRIAGVAVQVDGLAADAHKLGAQVGAAIAAVGELRGKLADLESARRIEVVIPERVTVEVGAQHEAFGPLVRMLGAGLNVWLKGPAGSGKTSGVHAASEALGLTFYAQSVGQQTSMSNLLGYIDANGRPVRSLLREAYEGGGVFLFDEIDAANASTLTIVNALLANHVSAFPDAMVTRHVDFHAVAAGNTYGRGADAVYIGRAQLDGASLDRFALLEWGYDWAAIAHWAGNDDWTAYVRRVSEAAAAIGARVVVGPRAAIDGAKMLAAGFSREEAEQARIWAAMSKDDAAKIRARL